MTADPKTARTLPELLCAAAAAYGSDPAVVFAEEGLPREELSFAALEARSAKLARGLIARGMGKGSRVGFIFGNGPGYATMFAAIARIGAIAVPISTMIRANELVRVLRQSDIGGLIVQRTMLGHDLVERLCDALPALRESSPDIRSAQAPYLRWVLSSGDGLPASVGQIESLASEGQAIGEDLLRAIESEVHPTDQLVEIYTSGSMALPKGVKHNHGPVLFRAHYIARMTGFERGKANNCALPMFWVGGLMMFLMPSLTVGAITMCTERTLSNSQIAMGSVLADDDLKLLAATAKPYWGLGMSETIGPYSYGDDLRAPGRPMCAPMDHFAERYDIRIADEDNQPVGDGKIGEMQVRGYPVTPGLHKMERDDYFTPDGYYRTGDLCLIEGSRVHFVGRGGDMIKTAGSNVSPAEVELEMQSLEGVYSAYVVGVADPDRGQLVCAAVVPRDGVTLDPAALEAELKKRLSSYKVPRAYAIIAREDVPLLHSNKVARRQIAAMMAERLGVQA